MVPIPYMTRWGLPYQNYHQYVRGWSGGAKVLGKLPVPGRPTNLG